MTVIQYNIPLLQYQYCHVFLYNHIVPDSIFKKFPIIIL